jgi:sugar/nucleoside kinase (ribokinase family)
VGELGGELKRLDGWLEKLSDLGAKISIITADVFGVRAFDGKKFYFQPAPAVKKVVNTTGAGDAFAATFVAAQIRGLDITSSLKLASENAGSVLQQVGAQPGLARNKLR